MRQTRRLVAFALAAGLTAGCGGGSASGPDRGPAASADRTRALGPRETERLLGSSFRRALYRLAVMTQTGDEPADLGQPLPTGLLRTTRCAPDRASRLSCTIDWQTVDGRPRETAYRVDLSRGGCAYATARPPLPQVLDVTTEALAESPLGALVTAVPGC